MLPKRDGFELVEKLREVNDKIPFIFLTARSLKTDRINGYKAGADDYILKPFDADELVFKIKAILRRARGTEKNLDKITLGETVYQVSDRLLMCGNEKNLLSNKEALLIEMFFKSPNTTITKSNLLKAVWGRDDYFTAKSMEVYLTKVRKYLKADELIELRNIHGYGYRLVTKTIEEN